MIPGLTHRRRFTDLSEQEVLALAISSEEDDARIYETYAERLRADFPQSAKRFDEILRAIDSIQLTAKHQVATPAQWQHGDDVIITPAVSDEDAEARFGGFERVLPYLRKTKMPTG